MLSKCLLNDWKEDKEKEGSELGKDQCGHNKEFVFFPEVSDFKLGF